MSCRFFSLVSTFYDSTIRYSLYVLYGALLNALKMSIIHDNSMHFRILDREKKLENKQKNEQINRYI